MLMFRTFFASGIHEVFCDVSDRTKKRNYHINQGQIHGNPVADSWAGAVMQKPHGIQKCDRWTKRHGKV